MTLATENSDAGFDGRQTQDGDVIPSVRRHGIFRAPESIARDNLVAPARTDGLHGQRWNMKRAIPSPNASSVGPFAHEPQSAISEKFSSKGVSIISIIFISFDSSSLLSLEQSNSFLFGLIFCDHD